MFYFADKKLKMSPPSFSVAYLFTLLVFEK